MMSLMGMGILSWPLIRLIHTTRVSNGWGMYSMGAEMPSTVFQSLPSFSDIHTWPAKMSKYETTYGRNESEITSESSHAPIRRGISANEADVAFAYR